MKEETAKQCAQDRAERTNQMYVAIQASNGQWMCERKEFADKNYPLNAKRYIYGFKLSGKMRVIDTRPLGEAEEVQS